jgi:hypothetical protein
MMLLSGVGCSTCCTIHVNQILIVLCSSNSLLSPQYLQWLCITLFTVTIATVTVTTVHTPDSTDDVPAYTGA